MAIENYATAPAKDGGWRASVEWAATVAGTAVTIVLGAALAWWLLTARGPQPPPPLDVTGKPPIDLAGAVTEGNTHAQAVMVEHSDFRCPFCRRFATETLPTLRQTYIDTGKVVLVFEQLPIHEFASDAAAAAICAARQNKFRPLHDLMFANQEALAAGPQAIAPLAARAGLDSDVFSSCLAAPSTEARIKSDQETAAAYGVTGTPTFLFGTQGANGKVHVLSGFAGAQPLAAFTHALDAALRASTDRR